MEPKPSSMMEQSVDAARKQCEESGLRLTPLREQVLRLVIGEGKPLKAYDILDRLRQDHAAAAPPTVYRALDFLLEHGFVHRLESINAFVGCGHPEAPHHSQFLICDRCDATLELDDHAVADQLQAAAEVQGFRAVTQTIEVHGVCGNCEDEGGQD